MYRCSPSSLCWLVGSTSSFHSTMCLSVHPSSHPPIHVAPRIPNYPPVCMSAACSPVFLDTIHPSIHPSINKSWLPLLATLTHSFARYRPTYPSCDENARDNIKTPSEIQDSVWANGTASTPCMLFSLLFFSVACEVHSGRDGEIYFYS